MIRHPLKRCARGGDEPLGHSSAVQAGAIAQDAGVRRLLNPHIYHVSLTERLWALKQTLIGSAMDRSR